MTSSPGGDDNNPPLGSHPIMAPPAAAKSTITSCCLTGQERGQNLLGRWRSETGLFLIVDMLAHL